MKKIFLSLITLFLFNNIISQDAPPEMFKFQALVVDDKGKAVKDQTVGIEILILKDALTGTLVYSETFNTMTNSNGLINLEIGNGTPTYGIFAEIPWGDGSFFLELQVDITGGTNYTSMGGSQLLSVPYALYTKTAKELDGPNDTDNQNEIQTLELNGNLLSLSDGGEVILPAVGNFSFYYADRDGDNYGDNWNVVYADIVPAGYVINDGDCNDLDASINPGATEIPEDGIDQDCDGMELYLDKDNDGFTSDVDCDDLDDTVYPGAEEVCDGKDNNCDGAVDNDCVIGDCVELWASVLQYVDVNCESPADIACVINSPNYDLLQYCTNMTCIINLALSESYPPEYETWTYDEAAAWLISQCGITDEDGDGFSPENGDCDDLDLTVYPGAPEICDDGIDQDCNGVDKLCNDEDGDGYVDVIFGGDDCDDANPDINPGQIEECDGLDNDCDGIVDNIDDRNNDDAYYIDSDGDGWGSDNDIIYSCVPVEGYVLGISGDCDDNDPAVYPLADELCDGKDNDCDGQIDETCDEDSDGYTVQEGDCDDANPDVYPGAEEICGDEIDNDCDGQVDETCGSDEDGDGFTIDGGDCDDTNPDIYPGADELCDELDNDCDGIVDNPVDSDVDGLLDCDEEFLLGTDPFNPDTDSDNVSDGVEVGGDIFNPLDTDNDGVINALDVDDDNDGILTINEDANGDGDPTNDDSDGDGIPDYLDPDLDGDGDGVPFDSDIDDNDPFVCKDIDSDGCDDCSSGTFNPDDDGPDLDGDGICDLTDPDADGDGFDSGGDCDDFNPGINPFAPEICDDNLDNNCNSAIDENNCINLILGAPYEWCSSPVLPCPDFTYDIICDASVIPFVFTPFVFLRNVATLELIQIPQVFFIAPNQITFSIPCEDGLPGFELGDVYDIIVVNPNGDSGVLPEAFSICAIPPP